MKQIFLGGTCGNNNWREDFINRAIARGIPPDVLFNPVVSDWNDEAQAREEEVKATASHLVYYIADPQQEGIPVSSYSLVEATMGLYDAPERTVVALDWTGMARPHAKAMAQAAAVLKTRFPEGNIFTTQTELLDWLAKSILVKSLKENFAEEEAL